MGCLTVGGLVIVFRDLPQALVWHVVYLWITGVSSDPGNNGRLKLACIVLSVVWKRFFILHSVQLLLQTVWDHLAGCRRIHLQCEKSVTPCNIDRRRWHVICKHRCDPLWHYAIGVIECHKSVKRIHEHMHQLYYDWCLCVWLVFRLMGPVYDIQTSFSFMS